MCICVCVWLVYCKNMLFYIFRLFTKERRISISTSIFFCADNKSLYDEFSNKQLNTILGIRFKSFLMRIKKSKSFEVIFFSYLRKWIIIVNNPISLIIWRNLIVDEITCRQWIRFIVQRIRLFIFLSIPKPVLNSVLKAICVFKYMNQK